MTVLGWKVLDPRTIPSSSKMALEKVVRACLDSLQEVKGTKFRQTHLNFINLVQFVKGMQDPVSRMSESLPG